MKRSLFDAVRACAGLVCVLFLMSGIAHAEQASVVTVSASGSATSIPDVAVVTLGVQSEAATARAALDANNKVMSDVLVALKGFGVAAKDMQTSDLAIAPQFHYPQNNRSGQPEAPSIIGYAVTNQLMVRVRDIARLGEILDMSVSLGVNAGGNIRFETDNTEKVLELARVQAVSNAFAKAETLAEAAGVKLGKILDISEVTGNSQPDWRRSMASEARVAASVVPVAEGEISHRVDIQIRWSIIQKK